MKNFKLLANTNSKLLNVHLRKLSSSNGINGNGIKLPDGTKYLCCKMNGEALVFVPPGENDKNMDSACTDGLKALSKQFSAVKDKIIENEKQNIFSKRYESFHFSPEGLSHLVTLLINMDDDIENGEEFAKLRLSIHKRFAFHIPQNRPLFKLGCAINFFNEQHNGSSSNEEGYVHITSNDYVGGVSPTPYKLKNVHVGLKKPGDDGTKLYLVQGEYIYYHYMQDRYDDKGWGCAYRSLQTLISWFRFNNYTNSSIPTHREIQEVLVDAGEKKRSFIGTKDWIGSQEVGRYLEHVLNVTFKIIFVRTGEELGNIAREVAKHFQTQGTPIMIGGGALAFTIIGVAWNDQTGATEYLILDPHYTGEDVLNTIQDRVVMLEGYKATACGWRGIDTFSKKDFYSLCCPQRPDVF